MLRRAKRLTKQVLRPLLRPWLTRGRLTRGLEALGVEKGKILLVHSSLSALGYVPSGPVGVLSALEEVIGPEGTLVLPAHSWHEMGQGCRTFDARATKSCVGALTEVFRKLPGVVRSLHPSHSVAARGPLARWLIRGHEYARTPCGEDTPYARALEKDCQVLLLGVGLDTNTVFHCLEALAELPYLMQEAPDEFTIVDEAGVSRRLAVARHRPRIPRRFPQLADMLVAAEILKCGRVGHVPCMLVRGRAFRDFLLPKLREEPYLLVAGGGHGAGDGAAGRNTVPTGSDANLCLG